jgi:pyridoxal phosphate enzyme (YggS family)
MAIANETYRGLLEELGAAVQLVAVSKTRPVEDILALYEQGQRDFGENYVQELADKQPQLPADIRWHFIGHLQSNKVKYIIPFVHLIHGVDSLRLLKEIDRQAGIKGRVADVLLQVHIAREETKFGLDPAELAGLLQQVRAGNAEAMAGAPEFQHVRIRGLMGMASFSDDPAAVREEFRGLKQLFDTYFSAVDDPVAAGIGPGILSMGMSADYKIAVEEGSNMVRIGSLLFGKRE